MINAARFGLFFSTARTETDLYEFWNKIVFYSKVGLVFVSRSKSSV